MTAGLEGYLREHGLLDGPITTQHRIGDGHSNITELVSDGARQLVVRRPPPPPIPPGANDVMREARIQRALAGSSVPVPVILAAEGTGDVLGQPFYVMEHLDGIVATTQTPAGLQGATIAHALVDALAALHGVDLVASGLEDLGTPSADMGRHLRRFARLVDPDGQGLDGELGDLLEWLADDPPAPGKATVIHGDFRLGNVMLAPQPPGTILAVLDWELAAIGDPLRDVGYFLATYAVPGERPHALTEMSAATLGEGWPSRSALAERYAAATATTLAHIDWYQAMALWKLAVLFEYQRRRVAEGIGDDYYAQPGLVEGFLAAARPIIRRRAPA